MLHYILKTAIGPSALKPAALLMLMLLLSCEYESHETYFKDIPEPDLSNLSINLSNDTNDTLYLFGKTQLNYSAFLNGRTTYATYVYVDDFHVATLQNNRTSFTLNAEEYEEGQHIIKLEIYASAGTGSLADVAGAEQLILTGQWLAYIDRSPPDNVDFSSVGIEDGRMTVHWTRYQKFNFGAYMLEKQYWNAPYNMYSTCWQKEITDKDLTSLTDSTYLSGKIRYRIRVKAGELFGDYTVKEFEYVYDPALQFEWIDREQVRVTWRKPRIADSFQQYETYLAPTTRNVITSLADTVVVLTPDLAFGQRVSFTLTVKPKGGRCEAWTQAHQHIYMGNDFAPFTGNKISYCKEIDQYFTRQYTGDDYELVRINGSTNKVEDSMLIDGEFSVSQNGKYLYITYDNVLRQLDPMTFSVLKTYNLYELSDVYTTVAANLAVSDNNRLSFATYDSSYVVEMPEFKVLYRAARDYGIGMSPSGNTLVSNGKVWNWDGTAFISKHNFTDAFDAVLKDDETLIKIYYRDKISIQNLSTYQETSIPLQENADVIAYDPESDLIGYAQESSGYDRTTTFHLIDIQARSVKQFPVAQLDNHRGEHIFLINNQILCSQGSSIPLSYYYP